MPAFSGPSSVVDELVQIYRAAVPQDIASDRRSLDEAYATAAIFAAAEGTIADWSRAVRIATATGVGLDALARDHGLTRQNGEDDETLRARLRVPPSAGAVGPILDALQLVVNAGGGGTVYLLQLPKDGIFLGRARLTRFPGMNAISNRSPMMSRGYRMSGGPVRAVVALIPASAHCLASATDALRSKVSAAKYYLVQEYA